VLAVAVVGMYTIKKRRRKEGREEGRNKKQEKGKRGMFKKSRGE
jgi:hypothetical protein